MNKNSIIFGVLVGLVVPLLGFGVWSLVNELLATLDIKNQFGETFQFSKRLVFLLSICSNIFAFRYFSHRYWEDAMRGTIFPTLFYVGLWVWRFHLGN